MACNVDEAKSDEFPIASAALEAHQMVMSTKTIKGQSNQNPFAQSTANSFDPSAIFWHCPQLPEHVNGMSKSGHPELLDPTQRFARQSCERVRSRHPLHGIALSQRVPTPHNAVLPVECSFANPISPMAKNEREQLRGLVRWVALRMTQHRSKPPFTIEEIVVMAVIAIGRGKAQEILRWILDHVRYYQVLAYDKAWCVWSEPARESNQFMSAFRDVFATFEVPLRKSEGSSVGVDLENDVWGISLDDALRFLPESFRAQLRGPTSSHGFRFLDLPPELRTIIYDMVLTFPTSGIYIKAGEYHPRGATLLTRHHNLQIHFHYWHRSQLLQTRLGSVITSLTLVNRQIYTEARYRFFICNNFTYPNIHALQQFLQCLSPEQRTHIGTITMSYEPRDFQHGAKALRMIAKIKHLRKLVVHIDEAEWMATTTQRDDLKYTDIMKIPGMRCLKDKRCASIVKLVGDCDNIRKEIDKAAREAKEKEKKRQNKKKEKKRKAIVATKKPRKQAMSG